MSLDNKDIQTIERLLYKSNDDVAVSISRSFERLEERIDAVESRIYSRLLGIEDRNDHYRQETADAIVDLTDEIRASLRPQFQLQYP